MANWAVPAPALLSDPDTWTHDNFHDKSDIMDPPYGILGLGEFPSCFFCKCSLLVRRRVSPDTPKEARCPQGKAMQRRRMFFPPFTKCFTKDLAEKIFPAWRECDECAVATVACAPRGALWFKSESDRGAGECQYLGCGQQTFDGRHLCPTHARTTCRDDTVEHRGAEGSLWTREGRDMIDIYQRRRCRHLMGDGEEDPDYKWTITLIGGKTYFTFAKEAGRVFTVGWQNWLLRQVAAISPLMQKFIDWKLAIGEDPFDSLSGIDYPAAAAAAGISWWQGGAPMLHELLGPAVAEGPAGIVRFSMAEGNMPTFGPVYGGRMSALPAWQCVKHQREEAFAEMASRGKQATDCPQCNESMRQEATWLRDCLPREMRGCKTNPNSVACAMDPWGSLIEHLWLDAPTLQASRVGIRCAFAGMRARAHFSGTTILPAGCARLTLRYRITEVKEKGFLIPSFFGITRVPSTCQHWEPFEHLLRTEKMLIQVATFGTEDECKMVLLFFFGNAPPSDACCLQVTEAIRLKLGLLDIAFQPAPCGVARELKQYHPLVLLATTYDVDHLAQRPVLRVAMRAILSGELEVAAFATIFFEPMKVQLAAAALKIFAVILSDEDSPAEMLAHAEAKEAVAGCVLMLLASEMPVNDEIIDMTQSLTSPYHYTGKYLRPSHNSARFDIGTGLALQPPTCHDLQDDRDIDCNQSEATALCDDHFDFDESPSSPSLVPAIRAWEAGLQHDALGQVHEAHMTRGLELEQMCKEAKARLRGLTEVATSAWQTCMTSTCRKTQSHNFDTPDGTRVTVLVAEQQEAYRKFTELQGAMHQDVAAAAFPDVKPLPTSRNLRQEDGYKTCHECDRIRSAKNTDCMQCVTVYKLEAMQVEGKDLEATDPLGPQQVGSQPQHAQEPSASSSSAPSCPQPVHAEEPVDYIQDPQAATVAVPEEQIQVWELTAREGRISGPEAKEEPLSKEACPGRRTRRWLFACS